MRSSRQKSMFRTAAAASLAIALTALSACGTVNRVTGGPEGGASTEQEARPAKPTDPVARSTQVGWTSARAKRCGFIFSPEQLRANYIAAERGAGHSPTKMQKIEKAYDYTLQSVTQTISANPTYCTKDRLAEIRVDLNRHIAGDYRPRTTPAR